MLSTGACERAKVSGGSTLHKRLLLLPVTFELASVDHKSVVEGLLDFTAHPGKPLCHNSVLPQVFGDVCRLELA